MTKPAIEATGLTKEYPLNQNRSLLSKLFRHNNDKDKSTKTSIMALDDVSLKINSGEAVGIIGPNGAGKSTLLKVLTRVTAPTKGRGIVRGRVGTILEVGTGFHPELSGKENIFLSGAILGLRWNEIKDRLDSIITFAGVEDFVDVPVKRYSSGMYVRLAFAVAAHLDPDILIVDEVLAVGDIAFQKRCLAKMEEETDRHGKTILFVSHNLDAIKSLCPRSILLSKGKIIADGSTSEVVQTYLGSQTTKFDLKEKSISDRKNRTGGNSRFTKLEIINARGEQKWLFSQGDKIIIKFEVKVIENIKSLALLVYFTSPIDSKLISTIKEVVSDKELSKGDVICGRFEISTDNLRANSLAVAMCLGNSDFSIFEDIIDSNVGLPFLEIESSEGDSFKRRGYFDLQYVMELM